MIIDFKNSPDTSRRPSEARHWQKILRALREESPFSNPYIEDDGFYVWLEETWKVKAIFSDIMMGRHISAIEVDDAAYSMLLLRFPE